MDTSDTETAITDTLGNIQNKFNFWQTIKSNVDDMTEVIEETQANARLTVHLGQTKYTNVGDYTIVDLSWYEPYKQTGDAIICVFAYFMFLWNMFIRLPDIISGGGAGVQAGTMAQDISRFNYLSNHSSSLEGFWQGRWRK